MNGVAAESGYQLDVMKIEIVATSHIDTKANHIANALSRMAEGATFPAELEGEWNVLFVDDAGDGYVVIADLLDDLGCFSG